MAPWTVSEKLILATNPEEAEVIAIFHFSLDFWHKPAITERKQFGKK